MATKKAASKPAANGGASSKAAASETPTLAAQTLEALDQVAAFDWKTASANRVPKLGEAYQKLVNPNPATRAKARDAIGETAGEHPIGGLLAPYLVRLLADPGAPDRADLLPLLTTIAVGPRPLGRFDARAFVGHLRRSRRERFAAVAAAAPVALTLLGDPSEGTRAAAARLLAYVQPDGLRASLCAAVEKESSALALGALLLALAVISTESTAAQDRSLLSRFSGHPDANVTLCAALARSLLAGPADEATLARLEQALTEPHLVWSGFPWLEGRMGALAAERYFALADRHLERVIEHAASALHGKPNDARALGWKMLQVLIPTPLPPGQPASAPAVAILRALLEQPGVVDSGFLANSQTFGLPTTLQGLRDLAGLDVPGPASIARAITVDGQTLPFHVAWLRRCWDRLSTDPDRLVELGFAGLSPEQTVEAFHDLVTLAGVQAPRLKLELPVEPRGKRKEYPKAIEPVFEYLDDEPAVERAVAFLEQMKKDGWEVIYAPLVSGNFGSALIARGGVELDIGTNVHWVDDKPTGASTLTVRPKLSIPRLLAPRAYAAHGDALLPLVAALASRADLENMPKWWTLQLTALLARLSGKAPDPAVDDLFRRCYVSWVPSTFRVSYLMVLPEQRAEDLALWLLSKERGAIWVADVVPSQKVKAKVASLKVG